MRPVNAWMLSDGFRRSWADSMAWSIADDEGLGTIVRRTCGSQVLGHPVGPRWVSACRRVALHCMVDVAGISVSDACHVLNLTTAGARGALRLHREHHERHETTMLPHSAVSDELALCRDWLPAFDGAMWECADEWWSLGRGLVVPADAEQQIATADRLAS